MGVTTCVSVACAQPGLRWHTGAALVSTFGGFALRANTVRSYATQTRTLEHLAAFYGVDLSKPLSELDLCILMSV